jgi:hypothetical protein
MQIQRFSQSFRSIASARATRVTAVLLLVLMMAQAAILCVFESGARKHGQEFAALTAAKTRLLTGSFSAHAASYLADVPLALVFGIASVGVLAPLVVILIGVLRPRDNSSADGDGRPPSAPLIEFAALCAAGATIVLLSNLVGMICQLSLGREALSLAVASRWVLASIASALAVLPSAGVVVALEALLRKRLVIWTIATALMIVCNTKALPAALSWISPRLYVGLVMTDFWRERLLGIGGLSVWVAVALVLATGKLRLPAKGAGLRLGDRAVGRTS